MAGKKLRPEVKIQADSIIDGVVHRVCPKCDETKSLDDFGLRKMADTGSQGQEQIRNQSWCRPCRK